MSVKNAADGPLRSGKDSYVAGVPLARVIPRVLEKGEEAVMLVAPRSLAAERFRRLSSMLEGNEHGRVIVVTSGIPREGKTTVAMNLALAFVAHASGETLVIDADLRRPTVHTWLKQPPGLGLSEVLQGKIGIDHAIHDLKNSPLKVLPAGTPSLDPMELLAAPETRDLLATLRGRYRQIVIDTPPVVPFADAGAIAKHADGVLLVARAGFTRRSIYDEAVSLLAPARILGTVLNVYAGSLADGRMDETSYYDYQRREPVR
jgi:capsular exopolysaccharide synthesis family protein